MDKLPFSTILEQLDEMSSEELEKLESGARSLCSSRKDVQALQLRSVDAGEQTVPALWYGQGLSAWTRLPGQAALSPPTSSQGGCGRTFNGLTGTPFSRMRKPERWSIFLQGKPWRWTSVAGRLAKARRRGSLPTDSMAHAQCSERGSGLREAGAGSAEILPRRGVLGVREDRRSGERHGSTCRC